MASASGGRQGDGNAAGDQRVRIKKPDRRRQELEVARLASAINKKEDELKDLQSLQSQADRGQLQNQLKQWRAEKDETIALRRNLDQELQTLTKEIANKRDGTAKIQGTLKYKQEDKINEAIKRLEYQLRVNNYKLNEERKIVKEIDNLNRSKRSLREYLAWKGELDRMREKQQAMREKRESLFKRVTDIRSLEEKSKREFSELQEQMSITKADIDSLYSQKRALVSEFKQACNEYYQQKEEERKCAQKQRDEEKKALQEAAICQEKQTVADPYLEERQLCLTLLAYLERFKVPGPTSCSSALNSPLESRSDFPMLMPHSEGHTPVSPTGGGSGVIAYRKEEGEVCRCVFGGNKQKCQSKKEKRKIQKRAIAHTPEVFHQFSKLGLRPPSVLAEVLVSVEQLKTKRKYYEKLSVAVPTSPLDEPGFPLYSLTEISRENTGKANGESECLCLDACAVSPPTDLRPWSMHLPTNENGPLEQSTWTSSNHSAVDLQMSSIDTNSLLESVTQLSDCHGTTSLCCTISEKKMPKLSSDEFIRDQGCATYENGLPEGSLTLLSSAFVQNQSMELGKSLEKTALSTPGVTTSDKLFDFGAVCIRVGEHPSTLIVNGIQTDEVESAEPSSLECSVPAHRLSDTCSLSVPVNCIACFTKH